MKIQDSLLRAKLLPATGLQPRSEYPGVPRQLTPAAVLITLHEAEGADWLLFTRRTEELRHHKGQISFPGGKFDSSDADLAATALRESWEEIGLLPEHVTLLGSLEPFPTITDYLVYPLVGRFDWPYELRLNPAEIAELIRIPLAHLHNPLYQRTDQREYAGEFFDVHYFDYAPHTIWGITGQILRDFLNHLG